MVTKMADKIGVKRGHFRPNLRLLETDFLRIIYQHSKIPKNPFNMLCAVVDCHAYFVKIFFLVFACALC